MAAAARRRLVVAALGACLVAAGCDSQVAGHGSYLEGLGTTTATPEQTSPAATPSAAPSAAPSTATPAAPPTSGGPAPGRQPSTVDGRGRHIRRDPG